MNDLINSCNILLNILKILDAVPENDPEMMWLTTMSPESRRLIKVLPTDVQRTAEVFDLLLGDNLQGRKEHIAEHGAEYLDDLDVS